MRFLPPSELHETRDLGTVGQLLQLAVLQNKGKGQAVA